MIDRIDVEPSGFSPDAHELASALRAGESTLRGVGRAPTRLGDGLQSQMQLLGLVSADASELRLLNELRRHGAAVAIDFGANPESWLAPRALPSTLPAAAQSPPVGCVLHPHPTFELPPPPRGLDFVIATLDVRFSPAWRAVPRLVPVSSTAEGLRAVQSGAAGLIARGQDVAGNHSQESSFVLLQRLLALCAGLAAPGTPALPVWCHGGIGLHTAAAAVAGGAAGVVLDALLAPYLEGQGQAQAAPDAALGALAFAACPNIESLVNTLRTRIAGQIHQARALRVLDAGNAWARSHGVRYPVAQGPMTRVSDNAAFAHAVASEGALPFLALALLEPDATRALLAQTRERLGALPWGVGVLGFAPPALLQAQLALVREARPAALLIAGGRPSQARPFVEIGIPTYLHVPSPALLVEFLKDGATDFVFEGRESGGHVGPRSSFVLWEEVLAVLERHPSPEQLHLLFAGGIHDERSAAMVAVLAAPLAARGAHIGILMGTAYIATAEAVASGAIVGAFQAKALAADATVLVETAPGHAIRCLPTPFVDRFEQERQRLAAAGAGTRETTEALEAFSVGRLRVATKGQQRDGSGLHAADAERQDAEGLYMIGQVAAMHSRVGTIAALHERVTVGATRHLEQRRLPQLKRAAGAEPIAIVGMACIYPGAQDLETFWSNVVEARDLIQEVPAQRWRSSQYHSSTAAPGKTVSKWGGFIEPVAFDPLAFGIPPQSLQAIEPAQLLALAVAAQALDDAGYGARAFDRQRTAVIFGASAGMDLANQYTFRNLYPQYCGELPAALDAALPQLTEDAFPGTLVNVIAGRIANRLGLGGTNYAVDAACASSLAAVELAVKELRAGTSDTVLAGGADFHNGIADFLMFSAVGALSPHGRCRAFDAGADGTSLGEGVGVVVLKRLADAERDGDRIYAVIDAVAGASDGRALGLTAPHRDGQKRAIERAHWQAGALAAEIGLVEAHGTGTAVGDRTELATLGEVFNGSGAVAGVTTLGSVKSQIGHTKCAAGVAGLIKVAKALHHRVLPPTLHIESPQPGYRAETSPFAFRRRAMPWAAASKKAAVSAFGFGGTNFHMLLSAHDAHASRCGAVRWPVELFIVRGADLEEAQRTLQAVADHLAASNLEPVLRDLAHTVWTASSGPVQMAFVVRDGPDCAAALLARIAEARARTPGTGVHFRSHVRGPAALLFPGQGSQYPDMLRDLFVYFPPLQQLLDGVQPQTIFPPAAFDDAARRQQRAALTETCQAQPALAQVELAAFRWLRSLGVQAAAAGGHSFGELVALATAGACDEAALIDLARARSAAMVSAGYGRDAGAMAAVNASASQVESLLAAAPGVVIANRNAPDQVVIAGPSTALAAACEHLRAQGLVCKMLETAAAFHSPLMAAAAPRFAAALEAQHFGALQWPVYANLTAGPHVHAEIAGVLARQLAQPVRFAEQIVRMHDDGARVFIEVGPRAVLTDLTRRCLKERPHRAIALDADNGSLGGLLEAAAQIATCTDGFDAAPLFQGRARIIDLAVARRRSTSAHWVDGGRCWPQESAAPAAAPAPALVAPLTATPGPHGTAAADQAVLAYLGNMRALVQAQRDVLVSFLGSTPAASALVPAATSPAAMVREDAAAAAASPAPAPRSVPAMSTADLLFDVVHQCTGYPPAHLDLVMDLEADLSIDSIKRIEILGRVAARLELADASREKDRFLEALAPLKTLGAMLQWIESHRPGIAGLHRHVFTQREVPATTEPDCQIAGQTFAVTDDGTGIAPQVAAALQARGATVVLLGDTPDAGPFDGVIDLRALSGADLATSAKRLLPLLRTAPSQHLLVAHCGTGSGSGGWSGLVRSIARECPATLRAQALALDDERSEGWAGLIVQSLCAARAWPASRWSAGKRWIVEPEIQPLEPAAARTLALGHESLIVVTGGGRGITAQIALELARRHRCRFEIVGRTAQPADLDAALADAAFDLPQLRGAILARDPRLKPADADREARRRRAAGELAHTLHRLRASGSTVTYTALDVADSVAFAAYLAGLQSRHARIDGVIHGAGMIEDRLWADKTETSFDRVFDTKVNSARVLHQQLRADVGFVVLMSSIASVFGSRGQADYAAANGELDALAERWSTQTTGRVLAVNWGPWAGVGMVDDALQREYERRGIALIAPALGVAALLDELASGSREARIMLLAGSADALA